MAEPIGDKVKIEDMSEGEIVDSEEDTDRQLYCICRTSDTNRFMIGCDKCEEWFHGNCIAITQEYAKRIKHFYCLMCRDKDPSLAIIYKDNKKQTNRKKETIEPTVGHSVRPPVTSDADAVPKNYERDPDYNPTDQKAVKRYFESEEEEEDDDDCYRPLAEEKRTKKEKTNRRKGRPVGPEKNTKKDKRGRKPSRNSTVRSRHRKKAETTKKTHKTRKEHTIEVETGPKQCYGPGCLAVARKASKYCSDECGVKLATNRIIEILPHRIRQWQSTPCEADERSHKTLETIRTEQQEARRILNDLDQRQKDLEILITKGKNTAPMTEEESNEADNEGETELSIYCVSCGHEINQKLALKHMERCYNKYESQTSFGSIFKTKIEGQTVFCDVYNPQQRTYCKRLRLLCPEHSKDPKIADDEVCGSPLASESCPFEHSGRFCRVLKKKCNKHHMWEKFRRAELDAERIQQWLKLDDLLEREQKFRYCMANRHGILGLMLHQTIVHDENDSQLH
ncbi:unnamed protein product [Medioppia subpectinata]|uniref:CXXC-type zinc finger protein 1 n=1 Tax=Medioppia subpectinata TaxID=1979941 RepID=A0A7R9PUV7_9ACAR|nr:unnamed protein product [Medioppia subpectinata]CAG2102166.1 unnamed protein product [Medioppia subpectinata]